MTDIDLAVEAVVDRPAEKIWALLADYDNDPRWRTGVISMDPRPPGIVGPGTRTRELIRFAGRTYRNDGEIVTVEPGVLLTWRTTSGADADGTRSITPLSADRSLVRLEMRIRPHGVERVFGPLLGRLMRRTMTRDLVKLRRLAES